MRGGEGGKLPAADVVLDLSRFFLNDTACELDALRVAHRDDRLRGKGAIDGYDFRQTQRRLCSRKQLLVEPVCVCVCVCV